MNALELLEKEHEDIERELLEMEAISESETINYPNLVHVFKKLHCTWNTHEEKEEKIFPIMKKENIIVPVKKMLFDHKDLRVHKWAMNKAIESGSEFEMKNALETRGKAIIEKLRKHIEDEDQVLYTTALSEFTDSEIDEMAQVAGIL